MFASFARSRTGAPGTLQITIAMSADSSFRSRASTRLWKSVPRPDARTPTRTFGIESSVFEQPNSRKDHRDPVLVRGADHFGVPDRAARLRDGRDGPLRELVEAIPEGEVRVAHGDA